MTDPVRATGWHATWVETLKFGWRGACGCGWRGALRKRSHKTAASDAVKHYDESRVGGAVDE